MAVFLLAPQFCRNIILHGYLQFVCYYYGDEARCGICYIKSALSFLHAFLL